MSGEPLNPWNVHRVEEFLYFCCPECDQRNKSKSEFLKHAFDSHTELVKESYLANYFDNAEDLDEKYAAIKQEALEIELREGNDYTLDYDYPTNYEAKQNDNNNFEHDDNSEPDPWDEDVKAEEMDSEVKEEPYDEKEEYYDDQYEDYPEYEPDEESTIDEGRDYTCERCFKSFEKKDGYSTHMRQVHNVIPRMKKKEKYDGSVKLFRCSFCPKGFTKDNLLFRHEQKAHDHTRQLPCERCGETFNFKNQLRQHCTKSHPDEFINCKRCASCFLRQEDLDVHLQIDHANDLECEICQATFVNR